MSTSWADRTRTRLHLTDPARITELEHQVAQLRTAVTESQRLNERLSDIIDVVAELLVPAMDRDDERVAAALASLDQVVSPSRRTP